MIYSGSEGIFLVLFSLIGLVFDDIFRYSLDTVAQEAGVFMEPDDEFTKEPEKVYFKRWYTFYSITIRAISF